MRRGRQIFSLARQLGIKQLASKKPAVSRHAGSSFQIEAAYALTSGPREAGPLEPPPPLGPPDFGLPLGAPGSFAGFGVPGPSTNSKPILSLPSALASSLTSTTRTWPPPFKW